MTWFLPEIPASAGALLFDDRERLLILKTTYKPGWTIPGGVMEADGETPWEACRREVLEETGLTITRGRLVAVDSRPAKPGRKLGLRFLFDCGIVTPDQAATIRLQAMEISEHRFAPRDEALDLLRKAVSRRVEAVWPASGPRDAQNCVYLESGRRVDGVD